MFKIIFLFITLQLSSLSHVRASDMHGHDSHNHSMGHTHVDVDGSKSK